MAERGFVVSNSSPLIALDRIGQLDLMRALFAEVVAPPAVLHEVFADSDPPAWLRVVAPAVMLDDAASPTLGRGEREAIALLGAVLSLRDANSCQIEFFANARDHVSIGVTWGECGPGHGAQQPDPARDRTGPPAVCCVGPGATAPLETYPDDFCLVLVYKRVHGVPPSWTDLASASYIGENAIPLCVLPRRAADPDGEVSG